MFPFKYSKSFLLCALSLSLMLTGCVNPPVSSECQKKCANLPASSLGEVYACEQKCIDPSGFYPAIGREYNDSHQDNGRDGGWF
jgi:hypothetical protein